MTTLHLTTFIAAPVEKVFDLSRSVRMHKLSMTDYREEIIAGITTGLMEKGDTVTWKANHLLKKRILKMKITEMDKYFSFTDEQVEGDFLLLKHQHHFKPCENGTIMIDIFSFSSPFGTIGKLFNQAYLSRYMKKLLEKRNSDIKKYAEGNQWKQLLS
jgi:ligand-binding SRPBCC domain-containing protein